MEAFMEELIEKRMGEPLEAELKKNEEFQAQQLAFLKKYHEMEECQQDQERKRLQEQISIDLGEYTFEYGKVAYCLGFHDGLGIRPESTGIDAPERQTYGQQSKNMTDLIYIYDSYKKISTMLFGEGALLPFHTDGSGAMGRLYRLIESYVGKAWLDSHSEDIDRILENDTLTPEERAQLLLTNYR